MVFAILLLVLGAGAGAYGFVAYTNAPGVEQQMAAGHFFTVAAVLIAGGAIVEAISKLKPRG